MTLESFARTTGACCASCETAVSRGNTQALTIACTLGPDDMAGRLARIRELAGRSLLQAEGQGTRLRLVYRADALDEVEAIVAAERECCAFLDFDLERNAEGIVLTIAAPVEDAAAAEALFAHFLAAPGATR